MWSKVVRKGEKWQTMVTANQARKLAATLMFTEFLSFSPKRDRELTGKCPK
jgi:hypothetical protein